MSGKKIEKSSESCVGGKIKYNVQFNEEEPPEEFEIDEKYELTEVIWYSVCSAIDKTTGEAVAIKKIRNITSSENQGQSALCELQILRDLGHTFIMKPKDVMLPSHKDTFDEVFIVSELLQHSLKDYLENIPQDEKGQKRVSNFNIKLILNQLLRVLQYMHVSDIFHRDIKPENILMDGMRVKLCDFGRSRHIENPISRYEGIPCYCPPEYFLNPETRSPQYGEGADVWGLGCVLSHLLHPDQGLPFDITSSSDEEEQELENLHKIAKIVRVTDYIEELYYFIEDPGMILFAREQLPHTPVEPLAEKFKDVEDKSAIDLLEKMLDFNPNKRISIEEALQHEYMADITVDVLARELNLDASEFEELENCFPTECVIDEVVDVEDDEFREELYDLCLSCKEQDEAEDETGDNAEDKVGNTTEDNAEVKTGDETEDNAKDKAGDETEDNAKDKAGDKTEDKAGDN